MRSARRLAWAWLLSGICAVTLGAELAELFRMPLTRLSYSVAGGPEERPLTLLLDFTLHLVAPPEQEASAADSRERRTIGRVLPMLVPDLLSAAGRMIGKERIATLRLPDARERIRLALEQQAGQAWAVQQAKAALPPSVLRVTIERFELR